MTKFLKKFNIHSEYNTYINGQDAILPNVSYCEDNDEVHYNPYIPPETKLVVTFNVTSTTTPTKLIYSSSASEFTDIEIDGVVQQNLVTEYTFATTGEHTVKYTLTDPTQISNNYPFYQCDDIVSVTVPYTVTSIGYYAFYQLPNLESVTLSDNITIIGQSAFQYCGKLRTINIPSNLTTIGDNAFSYCYYLESITIPSSVTTIGNYAFNNCYFTASKFINNSSLDEVSNDYWYATIVDSDTNGFCVLNNNLIFYRGTSNTPVIPNSVTSISNSAFYGRTGLTSISIPNSVTSIGQSAFGGCTGLTSIGGSGSGASVEIPSTVTYLQTYTFYNCTGLTSVTIPSSVTSISSDTFQGCTGVTSIEVDSNNPTYDSRNNCNAIITTSTNTLLFGCKTTVIPSTVTSIGGYAFYGCTGLTSIIIPSSVTSIARNAFIYCKDLTSITISSSTTSIGDYAFQGCTGLTSVTIPSSVTSIGTACFYSCTSLASVYCEPTTPPSLGGTGVFNSNASGRKIYVPSNSVNAYKNANRWSTYANDIEAIQ